MHVGDGVRIASSDSGLTYFREYWRKLIAGTKFSDQAKFLNARPN
jgi:hypothetical protein